VENFGEKKMTIKDRPETKSAPLTYAIRQIRIRNYHGITDTHVSGLPADAQWIFLTGENAFGKTAVLRALLIGLYGDRDGKTILFNSPSGIIADHAFLYLADDNRIRKFMLDGEFICFRDRAMDSCFRRSDKGRMMVDSCFRRNDRHFKQRYPQRHKKPGENAVSLRALR